MKPYSIEKPTTAALPLVFDSPHSGNIYPDDFKYACPPQILHAAEDTFVEDLFSATPAFGAAFLHAHFPRSYIDVNRRICDIDPQLLEDEWPENIKTEFDINPSSRSHAGIGLIRRLVKPGIPVYDRHLTPKEIINRIESCYVPYHNALADLIKQAHYNFGAVWHINCHSMPAASAYPKRGIGLIGNKPKPADFVLGDRDGKSCSHDFTFSIKAFLKDLGYTVSVNDPFKGVELVEQYSNPATGYHSLQIEINKSLYMDEATGEKSKNYKYLKSDIEKLIQFCAAYTNSQLKPLAAD